MATPNEKLADALAQLQKLQSDGRRVFRSNELTRVYRTRLIRLGFLREVIKGWLISSSPGVEAGDTTPWFASLWEFCARYCNQRFGDAWHLSADQSLLLHAENTTVPRQVIIYTPKGTNNTIGLPFGCSFYDLKQRETPPDADLVIRDGLRLLTLETALTRVPAKFFERHPVEARVALAGAREGSGVSRRLLDGGHPIVAGRLAGAFRRVGEARVADEILVAMKAAGYDVRESNPFEPQQTLVATRRTGAPIEGRLHTMWHSLRSSVIAIFPEEPGRPRDTTAYLRAVDGIYQNDAYHSLSIEGYHVSSELIERMRSGAWDPDRDAGDREGRDALAARGYWQAFQLVKKTVARTIAGEDPAALVRDAHRDWHRELFQPSVSAGLLRASDLASYRNDAVFLHDSRHVPPRWEAVRDAMPALFDLLDDEPEPSVRAVLGHWLFGYVHPYADGNGRIARFAMNAMLASGGYPWTIIRVEDRDAYMAALEAASVDMNIAPFARFIAERVQMSMMRLDGTTVDVPGSDAALAIDPRPTPAYVARWGRGPADATRTRAARTR